MHTNRYWNSPWISHGQMFVTKAPRQTVLTTKWPVVWKVLKLSYYRNTGRPLMCPVSRMSEKISHKKWVSCCIFNLYLHDRSNSSWLSVGPFAMEDIYVSSIRQFQSSCTLCRACRAQHVLFKKRQFPSIGCHKHWWSNKHNDNSRQSQ